MSKLTRIVAAVVDTRKVTLYKSDGTTVEMLQGDHRLRPILEHITPLLSTQGWAEIDLSTENSWKDFEEKTSGGVKLFRIAKSALSKLFGTKKDDPDLPIPSKTIGEVPMFQVETKKDVVKQNQAAVADIMKHAVPVKADDFNEDKVAPQRPTVEEDNRTPSDKTNDGKDGYFDKHEETIVAITPKGRIVPGVERIKSQFTSAAKTGSTGGMVLFLERLGAVLNQRKHTGEDLLRFMERGDLPVADDGTIIAYKRLQRRGDIYVDCHSGKVIQKVGSFVHMDISLVDPNRRNECSNGLHVARRGYIRSFSGNVLVLIKVRPEDVIAVPDYDANKMRVCGYHIIAELTPPQFQAIINNRPISEAEGGEELLGQAIAGHHIGITQRVKIGGGYGTNLTITDIATGEEKVSEIPASAAQDSCEEKGVYDLSEADEVTKAETPVVKKTVSKRAKKAARKVAVKKAVTTAKKVAPIEAASKRNPDKAVDIKAVQKLKEGKKSDLSNEKKEPITQASMVSDLWNKAMLGDAAKAKELLEFKKKSKKGWATWGLPVDATESLKNVIN